MIVTCTSCETRVRVAGERPGPAGRRIRCPACGDIFEAAGVRGEAPGDLAPPSASGARRDPFAPERPFPVPSPGGGAALAYAPAMLELEARTPLPLAFARSAPELVPLSAAAPDGDRVTLDSLSELDAPAESAPPDCAPASAPPSAPPAAAAEPTPQPRAARAEAPVPALPSPPARMAAGRRGSRAAAGANALLLAAGIGFTFVLLGGLGPRVPGGFLPRLGHRAVSPRDPFVRELSSGLYDTAAGPVLVVRGVVQTPAGATGPVRVRIDVLREGRVVAAGEAASGAVPTPEEVYAAGDPALGAKLRRALDARAARQLPAGGSAPFFVLFNPPQDLGEVDVRATILTATPAGRFRPGGGPAATLDARRKGS